MPAFSRSLARAALRDARPLQIGLIHQGQLVAAFQAWARDKDRSIAEHLLDRGALDAEQCTVVEAMVALHLKKHGGDPEKSLAALGAGRSTHQAAWPASATRGSTPPSPASARGRTTPIPTARRATPSAPPPVTASGFASCGPTPKSVQSVVKRLGSGSTTPLRRITRRRER